MKSLVVLCLLGMVYAVPAPFFLDSVRNSYDKTYDNDGTIYRFDIFDAIRGSYGYSYEQPDGTKQQQEGETVTKNGKDYLSVKGLFAYTGKDGVNYTVTYTADDNGFKPIIEQGPGGGVPDAVLASMLG